MVILSLCNVNMLVFDIIIAKYIHIKGEGKHEKN